MNNFKNRVSHDYLDVQERNITMFFEQKKKNIVKQNWKTKELSIKVSKMHIYFIPWI